MADDDDPLTMRGMRSCCTSFRLVNPSSALPTPNSPISIPTALLPLSPPRCRKELPRRSPADTCCERCESSWPSFLGSFLCWPPTRCCFRRPVPCCSGRSRAGGAFAKFGHMWHLAGSNQVRGLVTAASTVPSLLLLPGISLRPEPVSDSTLQRSFRVVHRDSHVRPRPKVHGEIRNLLYRRQLFAAFCVYCSSVPPAGAFLGPLPLRLFGADPCAGSTFTPTMKAQTQRKKRPTITSPQLNLN